VAIYARVSSNTQRNDLERQVESLKLWVSKSLPSLFQYSGLWSLT
jgi:predicted site-specific integrase-resolvase